MTEMEYLQAKAKAVRKIKSDRRKYKMSMKYYAVNDYGMVLDEKTAKMILSKIINNYDESEEDWRYTLYDEGICEYISDFTGEATCINDEGEDVWSDTYYYDNNELICVPLRIPKLFERVYSNIDEMVNELKEKLGEYLPDGYDYKSRICHICGTYYG
jgi:hypothetical protein